ncbi:MAG: Glyoxalase/Bleomycin resistance protein/Dihydroxybiphenyl dioxygenase [Benniella sp.]|nr:MAG: Glyoxalase/Bleomycin resistance protein/Dihydroxybiphenyl dioxygenase [Benniella sp.]
MSKTGAINHVAISVSDYERGQKFYDFLLKDLLGYDVKVSEPQFTLWISNSTGACVCVSPGTNVPHHKYNPGLHHLAFSAETPQLVDDFHERLVRFQEENKDTMSLSTILDAPQEYPQYRPGYYAVFFTDPDGIKLEIAHLPQKHY